MKVAIYGMNSAGAETFKNLEKLGVRHFYIGDSTPSTERDFPGNFYMNFEQAKSGKPRSHPFTSYFNGANESKTLATEVTLDQLQDSNYLLAQKINVVILN